VDNVKSAKSVVNYHRGKNDKVFKASKDVAANKDRDQIMKR
jgi:hypothetical protein